MFQSPTEKQKRVLDFYKKYIEENNNSPTYTEVWTALDISPSVVFSHVIKLEKMWYLRRSNNWTITLTSSKTKKLPVLGKIACWEPIEVSEYVEDEIEVPDSMLWAWNAWYILKAKGTSMQDAGIYDWDFLIIKHQNTVNDWDIAVVILQDWFDEKATLKQVFMTPNYTILKPKNPVFEPIYTKNCEIRGKLVGVIRNFQ